jgi:hypothetical protein
MSKMRRRDSSGASVLEYALLMALVLLVVFASIYALGRTPQEPASVLSDTFTRPPSGGGPPATPPTSTTTSTTTTTTIAP